MSTTDVVRAAGGIVVRDEGEERRVALVHRPKYDDWSFPKGKLLDDEIEEAAALREVEEETGFRCRLGSHVGAVTYTDRTGRPKVVRYWTMSPEGGTFSPSREVDELRWATMDEAQELLSYTHDRDLLRSIAGLRARSPLYLVRHAKAGSRQRWTHADEERPLTRRGRRQARRLVEYLHGLQVERVVSSPFRRCVQTIEPLATARGLEIEIAPELAEGVEVDRVARYVASLDERTAVLCGHGREIEAMVAALEDGGADVGGRRALAKGSVWVLERLDGRIVSARYLPAPPG